MWAYSSYYSVYKYSFVFGNAPPYDCCGDANARAMLFARASVRVQATNAHQRLDNLQQGAFQSYKLIISDTFAAINGPWKRLNRVLYRICCGVLIEPWLSFSPIYFFS